MKLACWCTRCHVEITLEVPHELMGAAPSIPKLRQAVVDSGHRCKYQKAALGPFNFQTQPETLGVWGKL